MTIIAHLVLWSVLTVVLWAVADTTKPGKDMGLKLVAAGIVAFAFLAVPISLICVVRFWWGD